MPRGAKQQSTMPVVKVGDREFQLDELTFNELSDFEDAMGAPLGEIEYGSIKSIRFIAYLFERRIDADATPESVGEKLTMGQLMDGQDDGDAADPLD